MTRILIVDDDPGALGLLSGQVERAGFVPLTATSGESALRLLRSDANIGAVLLDLIMPDLDGMGVLERMAQDRIRTPVIVLAAQSSPATVATATRAGAVDFLVKPTSDERVALSVRNVLRLRVLEEAIGVDQRQRDSVLTLADIVTCSPAMDRVLAFTAKAAKTALPILIEGEAGTGKARLARIIHGMGERAGRPLATADCSDGILRPPAGTATLLLHEVGELDVPGQAQLLSLLDSGSRIIGTSRIRLLNLARTGDFREDLFYRLNVLPIYLPPLRERSEDIPVLAEHFLARAAAETGRRSAGIGPDALRLLARHSWPGNVRELERAVFRAVSLSNGHMLEPADFPQIAAAVSGREDAARLTESRSLQSLPIHIDAATARPKATAMGRTGNRFLTASGDVAALPDLERDLIAFAIRHYGGRMSKIARSLGIGRSTLYRKLREYGLDEGIESDAA